MAEIINWSAIGERIRQRRTYKGLALQDLATAAKLAPQVLNDLEHGKPGASKPLSLRDLTAIAKALDTTIDALAGLPTAAPVQPITVFSCGRPKRLPCSSCGAPGATTACTHPVKRAGQPATCDRKLCSRCAMPAEDGVVRCPAHDRMVKAEVSGG